MTRFPDKMLAEVYTLRVDIFARVVTVRLVALAVVTLAVTALSVRTLAVVTKIEAALSVRMFAVVRLEVDETLRVVEYTNGIVSVSELKIVLDASEDIPAVKRLVVVTALET